jgi:hypothetical protein
MPRSATASHLKVATDFSIRRTLRSPAGDFLKAGASPPSVLHCKGFNGDGYHRHRACQVQQLDIPNEAF